MDSTINFHKLVRTFLTMIFLSLLIAPLFPMALGLGLRLEHLFVLGFALLITVSNLDSSRKLLFERFPYFLGIVFVTSLYWWGYYSDLSFIKGIEAYLLGILVFVPTVVSIYKNPQQICKWGPLTVLLGLFVLFLISYDPERIGRTRSIFSNYNQLSRIALFGSTFALLLLEFKGFLFTKERSDKILTALILLIGFGLILLSSSRSATVGFAALIVISLALNPKLIVPVLLSASVVLASVFSLDSGKYISSRFEKMYSRFIEQPEEDDSVLARGYNRFSEHPSAILFGKGEGLQKRFNADGLEFHSTYGNILFSYGILGLISFLYATINFKPKRLYPFLFLLPVLINSGFHNDVRNIYFWLILALVFIFTSINLSDQKDAKSTA